MRSRAKARAAKLPRRFLAVRVWARLSAVLLGEEQARLLGLWRAPALELLWLPPKKVSSCKSRANLCSNSDLINPWRCRSRANPSYLSWVGSGNVAHPFTKVLPGFLFSSITLTCPPQPASPESRNSNKSTLPDRRTQGERLRPQNQEGWQSILRRIFAGYRIRNSCRPCDSQGSTASLFLSLGQLMPATCGKL